jgi:hypothetical protein
VLYSLYSFTLQKCLTHDRVSIKFSCHYFNGSKVDIKGFSTKATEALYFCCHYVISLTFKFRSRIIGYPGTKNGKF